MDKCCENDHIQKSNFAKITKSPETLTEYMCLHDWKMMDYQKCLDWLKEKVTQNG